MDEWYSVAFERPRKRLEINGHIIEYEKELNQLTQYGGGLLEYIEMNAKNDNGNYVVYGNEEKEEALRCYVQYLQYCFYNKNDDMWFHPTKLLVQNNQPLKACSKQLGYLICCGAELSDALRYFGMLDDCSQILGELFIVMGDWVCDAFMRDKEKKWRDLVSIGMKWAFVCRPNESLRNAALIKTLIDFYNIQSLIA